MRAVAKLFSVILVAAVGTALPALADGPRSEVVVSAVGASTSNSRTGYLSYRGVLRGSFDDGLLVRLDGVSSKFSYPGGSGKRNVARAALVYVQSFTGGKLELGAGISIGSEKNTPAVASDFSRTGGFLMAQGQVNVTEGHKITAIAEYDTPDKQIFATVFYEGKFGNLGIGPVVSSVKNANYDRMQGGLRVSYAFSDAGEWTLTATTGSEKPGALVRRTVSMMEMGLRLRF